MRQKPVSYITTVIEIRRAVNGYVVKHGYFKLKGEDIQAHMEETIIFAEQSSMLEWLRENT